VFLLVLGRLPSAQERALAKAFIQGPAEDSSENPLWEQYCHMLLISNEALYRP